MRSMVEGAWGAPAGWGEGGGGRGGRGGAAPPPAPPRPPPPRHLPRFAGEENEAAHLHHHDFIWLVVCSIWSAEVTTLEFIS